MGGIVEWLRLEGFIKELFDVAVILCGSRCPMALGVERPEVQHTIQFRSPSFGPLSLDSDYAQAGRSDAARGARCAAGATGQRTGGERVVEVEGHDVTLDGGRHRVTTGVLVLSCGSLAATGNRVAARIVCEEFKSPAIIRI